MKRILFLLAFVVSAQSFSTEPFYYFVPPKNWKLVDNKRLTSNIKIAFVGKHKKPFKPSINLAIEKTQATFKEYLSCVKTLFDTDRKNKYSEIGFIETPSGKAHIAQIDTKTECGDVRALQCILVKDFTAYILTGVVLHEDFFDFHDTFLKSFESLTVSSSPEDTIDSPTLKSLFQREFSALKNELKSNYVKDGTKSSKFQKMHWKPFEKKILKTHFSEKGLCWQINVAKSLTL